MSLSAKVEKELKAQKDRLKAIKYLTSQGESIPSNGQAPQTQTLAKRDNTLELMLRNRAMESNADKCHIVSSAASQLATKRNATVTLSSNDNVMSSPWSKVVDPATSLCYYWNVETNETSWELPHQVVKPEPITNETSSSSAMSALVVLPGGWKERVHVATKQVYYLNEKTGQRSAIFPSFDKTLSKPTEGNTTQPVQSKAKTNAEDHAIKRQRVNVDPLDFTDGMGSYSSNVAKDGKLADSTSSGPLWLHRPYPAPGKVKSKPDSKTNIGPSMR